MLPATKSGAVSPPDFIALFLLETAAEDNRFPLIHHWEVGFGEPVPPSSRPVGRSELSALCSLASAARRGAGIHEISGSSAEGYWARLSLRPFDSAQGQGRLPGSTDDASGAR